MTDAPNPGKKAVTIGGYYVGGDGTRYAVIKDSCPSPAYIPARYLLPLPPALTAEDAAVIEAAMLFVEKIDADIAACRDGSTYWEASSMPFVMAVHARRAALAPPPVMDPIEPSTQFRRDVEAVILQMFGQFITAARAKGGVP